MGCDGIWHDMTQEHITGWNIMISYNTNQYKMRWDNITGCDTGGCNAVPYDTHWDTKAHDIIQHNAMLHGVIQHDTLWHDITQYYTICTLFFTQHVKLWNHMIRHDMLVSMWYKITHIMILNHLK